MAARPMNATEWSILLALSVLWGGSFFFNGIIVHDLPPLTAVAARVAGGAVVLLLVMRARGVALPVGGRVWLALLGVGLLNNAIPFVMIVWGQTRIPSGLAAILNATTPLFAVLVAHVLTRDEKLTRAKIGGVALGLAGVAVLIGPELLGGLGRNLWAQLAVIGAAVSYAFAGVYSRHFRALGLDPVATATGQLTTAAIVLIPVALIVDRTWALPVPSWPTWGALAGLALLSTALAYVLYFRLINSAGPTNAILVTLLVPVTATLLGVVVLGERLDGTSIAGMALIAAGLGLIDGRALTALGRRRVGPMPP